MMTDDKTHLQSFPEAVDECLEEGFIVGNGLQDIPVCSHVADGPLAQTSAAQPEYVATVQSRQDMSQY